MRYFLDTEFNGYKGDLISLALVADDGRELYLYNDCDNPVEWVDENVIPVIYAKKARPQRCLLYDFSFYIEAFLRGDAHPIIVADWPDDIIYFNQCLIIGAGTMIDLPDFTMMVMRVDSYPTDLPHAVQHNALWDARALRHKIKGMS